MLKFLFLSRGVLGCSATTPLILCSSFSFLLSLSLFPLSFCHSVVSSIDTLLFTREDNVRESTHKNHYEKNHQSSVTDGGGLPDLIICQLR